ncbi:MAG: DUF3306 domain-containing protein [Ideonella sp.]
MSEDDNFLSRWSRRKTELKSVRIQDGVAPDIGLAPNAASLASEKPRPDGSGGLQRQAEPTFDALPAGAGLPAADVESAAAPPPTLADVALLTRDDSYARFVAPDVDPAVRNAAMKKLFTDPHFNVMDGLDIYIDDYGKPDPIPMEMLRRMTQSKSLGLFDHEDEDKDDGGGERASERPAAPNPDQTLPVVAETSPDEDPDLQLQPDDGTRRARAGARPDEPAES